MGKFFKFIWTRLNISGTNGFVELNIYQEVDRGILSIIPRFHRYNHWGWGEICSFGFPFTLSIVSGVKDFVKFKIDKRIRRGAVSSSLKVLTIGFGEKLRFYVSLFST